MPKGLTPETLFGSSESAQAFVLPRIRSASERRRMHNSHKRVIDSNDKDLSGILQLLRIDIAGDVRVRAGWALQVSETMFTMDSHRKQNSFSKSINKTRSDLLNAAGTPIRRALPEESSLTSTLLPGEFSTSTPLSCGSLSPTLIRARDELWNDRAGPLAVRANRRRTDIDAILLQLMELFWRDVVKRLRPSFLYWLENIRAMIHTTCSLVGHFPSNFSPFHQISQF
jgi:hypothetical protein